MPFFSSVRNIKVITRLSYRCYTNPLVLVAFAVHQCKRLETSLSWLIAISVLAAKQSKTDDVFLKARLVLWVIQDDYEIIPVPDVPGYLRASKHKLNPANRCIRSWSYDTSGCIRVCTYSEQEAFQARQCYGHHLSNTLGTRVCIQAFLRYLLAWCAKDSLNETYM